jgi:hypothetical protein
VLTYAGSRRGKNISVKREKRICYFQFAESEEILQVCLLDIKYNRVTTDLNVGS